MPNYRYKAVDAAGKTKSGRMDAASLAELEARLAHLGLDLIDGTPSRTILPVARRLPRRKLIDFCFHLEQFCSAGVPIAEALRDLRDSADETRFRATVAALAEAVEGGMRLSQAMAEQGRTFDEITVSLIRVGEDSGKLPDVLRQLVASLKWQDELASRMRYLALYPTLLTIVTVGLILFMAVYLVPRLTSLMQGMGRQLPLHTEILMTASRFVSDWWPTLLGMPAAMLLVVAAAIERNPRLRCAWDSLCLRLPVIGDILRKAVLARFADAFALMYAAGIPVLDALHATRNVAGNLAIARGIRQAARSVSSGESITAAFQHTGLFPPLVLRMLRVGESTGALDEALRNAGYFLGRDVREAVERVQTLMEPGAIVIIGVVMGWIILSVLGPVYDLIAGM